MTNTVNSPVSREAREALLRQTAEIERDHYTYKLRLALQYLDEVGAEIEERKSFKPTHAKMDLLEAQPAGRA